MNTSDRTRESSADTSSSSDTDVSSPKKELRHSVSSVDSESDIGSPNKRKRSHSQSDSESEDGRTKKSLRHSMSSMESATGDDTTDDTDHTDREDVPSYSKMAQPRKETVYTDVKAAKMMAMMGYKAGHGLGKNAQGIVEPVEVSKQRGRRGLGLALKGLEPENLEWNSEGEHVVVEEEVDWLEEDNHETLDPPNGWIEEGRRKLTIHDEDTFCDTTIVRDVLENKTTFDQLEGQELRRAVARSNPFENIRGGIFLNRAAMKMANMDRVFDSMFTNPLLQDGTPMVGDNELLYFADVCAGPGGFSEYVLWRRKWKARGFGFTLKGQNDFKLSDFYAGPPESFEPHYGAKNDDQEGDGDVYNPRNQIEFSTFVLENTKQRGVHFMMADGGFSVEGQENIQEILSKQIYLCQCLVALMIVRTGGHFVCKVFDLFTPFSVGLVYLMYKAFHKVSIHKPNTSRPANSERYIICKWKREDCEAIQKYMFKVNERLCRYGTASERDIVSLVPISEMKQDRKFFTYITKSNSKLGFRQIVGLKKVITYCKDHMLEEPRQAEMRKKCLKYWGVPENARTVPTRYKPDDLCNIILTNPNKEKGGKQFGRNIFQSLEKELTANNISNAFNSIFDWHCTVLGNPRKSDTSVTFFLGLGRTNVFYWKGQSWAKLINVTLELSAGTLLLGEIVREIRGEKQSQVRTFALHIIDAVRLGDIDIRHMHITERHKQCELFAAAMNKPSRTDQSPVRVRELFELEELHVIAQRLYNRIMKNNKEQKVFDLGRGDSSCIVPEGLLFFNATREPWTRHISMKTLMKYYFNTKNAQSFYDKERPAEACLSFSDAYSTRMVSWWDSSSSSLHIADILEMVHQKCNPPAPPPAQQHQRHPHHH